MATGIEIAGLALAVFPIVIEGLEFYLKAFSITKRYWRYASVLKSLLRELGMEKIKFENSCEELLFDIADLGDIDPLLAEPNGPLRQQPHFQSALQA